MRSHVLTRKCVVHAPGSVFCVHPPSLSSELRLTGRENATKKINLGGSQFLRFLSRITFLKSTTSSFLGVDLTSQVTSSITSGLTTYHPAKCVVAILSNSKTKCVCSTRMLTTTEKRKMKLGIRVLLWSTRSYQYLAIPGPILQAFFLFLGWKRSPYLVAIAFASRPMQSLLRGALVLLTKVGPVNLRPYLVEKSDCDVCLFVHALYERYQSARCDRGILPKHLTSRCLVGTSYWSHNFAVCPRSTY